MNKIDWFKAPEGTTHYDSWNPHARWTKWDGQHLWKFCETLKHWYLSRANTQSAQEITNPRYVPMPADCYRRQVHVVDAIEDVISSLVSKDFRRATAEALYDAGYRKVHP